LKTASRLGVEWAQMLDASPGIYWPWYGPPPIIAQIILQQCGDYTPRPLECRVVLGYGYPEQPPCGDEPGPGGIIIPTLEVYIVANTFSLVRASDNAPLTASEFSASLDRDSWAWSWSAKIPASQQALVEPIAGDPIEVIATINGNPLRLLLERISRERRFGEAWLSISGRGRAAWLAEPYAEIVSFANAELRTAQQLMAEALQVNNVPIGWALDWRITDWNVPAGAWSHQGTHMDAVTRIAEAGGAYVQAHDTSQTLIVLPHYPAMPRDWGSLTPDLTLPEAVCETEGIEWIDRPAYNTLWIVGGAGGRKDQIRLTGSAADRPAQTIVDSLATDTQMTRQRGIRVLADTGRQAHISIRLPVLPETGIIHPGQLLDYTEQGTTRRGLVRSVSVQHAFPQVWQSVRIETHG
ncbi:MAG: hypothetical protein HQL47_09970, partial [Gammaproteobacteria bacterium]|nr:hypothetical protein [Gammaproteobacteria bacterium]